MDIRYRTLAGFLEIDRVFNIYNGFYSFLQYRGILKINIKISANKAMLSVLIGLKWLRLGFNDNNL